MEGKMLKKCRFWHVRTRNSFANTLTTCTTRLIPIWIVVYRRQGLYLKLCISRILPGGVIFSMDVKIYLYQNICTHSVTESKTHDLAIVFILLQHHSVTWHLLASTTLDLSEMRPVHVVTSLMFHLKRPLRYGGYLCNQIQQNNFEMC